MFLFLFLLPFSLDCITTFPSAQPKSRKALFKFFSTTDRAYLMVMKLSHSNTMENQNLPIDRHFSSSFDGGEKKLFISANFVDNWNFLFYFLCYESDKFFIQYLLLFSVFHLCFATAHKHRTLKHTQQTHPPLFPFHFSPHLSLLYCNLS